MPIKGNIDEIVTHYWDALNKENRISLAIKLIPPSGESQIRIINRYQTVQ
jgi:hypothetical protein